MTMPPANSKTYCLLLLISSGNVAVIMRSVLTRMSLTIFILSPVIMCQRLPPVLLIITDR